MHTTSLFALGGLAASAAAHTIHGALVFARHGDRTTKHYGSQGLTNLGAQQMFQVGSFYRSRYLSSESRLRIPGISEFKYDPAQVYASAPDQSILLDSATAFLQGFYPPVGEDGNAQAAAAQVLANGTSVSTPLAGYQYVTLHGVNDDSPETIWLKGDDNCPAQASASASYRSSAEYQSLLASTRDFYRSLHPLLSDVYPSASDLSYASAYDIFDLVNVARVHNASSSSSSSPPVSDTTLDQLRALASTFSFGANFNASQPARSIHGATFAGAVLAHLNRTVALGDPKFTLLTGSYDTFLAFFGLAGLPAASADFSGLPEYASTMAFEVFSHDDVLRTPDDARVRFLFRNGTGDAAELTPFPLFGLGREELGWGEFVRAMQGLAVTSVEGWCDACGSEAPFCRALGRVGADGVLGEGVKDKVDRAAWIAVVVVMAVALAGNAVWAGLWVKERRERAERRRLAAAVGMAKETESVRSGESV
ncbi:hypothetical protein VTK26DRAFT_2872 [Humicola hyalothermophila]